MNALGNLHLDAAIPVTVAATSLKVMRVSHKTHFLLRRGYEDLCKALRCLSVCSYVLSCALSCALLFALPCAPDALLRSWSLLCAPGRSCALSCGPVCSCVLLRAPVRSPALMRALLRSCGLSCEPMRSPALLCASVRSYTRSPALSCSLLRSCAVLCALLWSCALSCATALAHVIIFLMKSASLPKYSHQLNVPFCRFFTPCK